MTDKSKTASGVRMALSLMPGTNFAEKAGRLGCSTTTLDRWRFGASLPSPESLSRLSELSGMTVDDIVAGRLPSDS